MSTEAIEVTEEPINQFNEAEHYEDDDVVDAEFDESASTALAIEPFSLHKERVTLVNLNLRSENHGDESVPACDIKLSLKTSNAILKKLRPGLLEDFYTRDRQGDVEDGFLRKLKHPQMGPVSWEFELPRAVLRFHDIDSEQNDVVLGGGKANKFKLTMMDGGSVQIDFRVQFSEPDEDAIAPLMRVLKQVIPISLSSEAVEEQPDNFQQVDLLSVVDAPKSAARLAADALFDQLPDDPSDTDEVFEAIANCNQDPEETPSNVEPIRKRQKRSAAVAE